MNLTAECNNECYATQLCTTCGKRKAPRGHLVPDMMAMSLCREDCKGYFQDPKPGHLWPSEKETA